MLLSLPRSGTKGGYAHEHGAPTHLPEFAVTRFLERWNSVQYACFARVLLVGLNRASLLLPRIRSSLQRNRQRNDSSIMSW